MKRLICIALSVLMLAAVLSGCQAKKEEVALKVWGSQEDQALLTELTEGFKTAHPEKIYTIELGVVSEADVRERYLEDPAAAADVFAFPDDVESLRTAGGLYEVTRNKDDVVKRNVPGSIEASSWDGKLYAYPMTADNGYFLYYDKSVLSETDVQSLDGMLAACDAAGKKVFMDVSNGWYIASFFLSAGCKFYQDDAGVKTCDFNNAKGLAAAETIKAFTAHNAFTTGDDSVLKAGIGDTIAAGVSGTWNAEDIKAKLGDNYAATKLPTCTISGEQVQMTSFAGYKLVGVNSQSKNPTDAMDLADWLTSEKSQIRRFELRGNGPSNIKAADSDAVRANVALAALAYQSQFATAQLRVSDAYWSPAEAFGAALEVKDYSKSLQEMLDAMAGQINGG